MVVVILRKLSQICVYVIKRADVAIHCCIQLMKIKHISIAIRILLLLVFFLCRAGN